MAIPFNIPNNNQQSQQQQQPTQNQNQAANSPSEPELPQFESFDSEILIQAFYEAICRCAQESQLSPPMSPSSPANHNQFQYNFPFNWNEQSPSTSTNSTPRQSFRRTSRSRHSQRSQGQSSEVGVDEEVRLDDSIQSDNMNISRDEEFNSQIPQPKRFKSSNSAANKQKPKKESKITSFVIGALQYVIDTLRDPKETSTSQLKK